MKQTNATLQVRFITGLERGFHLRDRSVAHNRTRVQYPLFPRSAQSVRQSEVASRAKMERRKRGLTRGIDGGENVVR